MRLGWLLALCWLAALTHPLLDLQNVYAIQLLSPASQRWFHSDGLFIVSPWLLAMLGVGIWRSREAGTGGAAVAALVASVAFIVANVAISAFAWQAAPGRPDRVFASPEPLAFWRREVVWRQDGAIGRGSYDPFMSLRKLTTSTALVPDNMALPLVRQAVGASADAQRFLDWSQMPMARVERSGCTATVTFADARFASTPIKGSFTRSVDLEMCRPPG